MVKKLSGFFRALSYSANGKYAVIYMRSYGIFVIMDIATFDSAYVQMFIFGKYDKNLFELVVSSPYSKIYKLKKFASGSLGN